MSDYHDDLQPDYVADPQFNPQRMPPSTIDDLDFSIRTYNCLKREGIYQIAQLVTRTETDLLDIRNFGQRGVDEVKDKLAAIGKSLMVRPAPGFGAFYPGEVVHEQINVYHCGGITVTVQADGQVQLSTSQFWPQDFDNLCQIIDQIKKDREDRQKEDIDEDSK